MGINPRKFGVAFSHSVLLRIMEDGGDDLKQAMRVLTSSETNEWYTPPEVIKLVRLVLNDIELDPASCRAANKIVGAKIYYTVDGLWASWKCSTLFLNPPYGKIGNRSGQDVWMEKLISELPTIGACIALTKTVPGYEWWDKLFNGCWPGPMCITEGRLSFVSSTGALRGQSKAASSFWYYGNDPQRFADVFCRIGRIIQEI